MRNLLTSAALILSASAAFLACDKPATSGADAGMRIAYVNTDSVLNQYIYLNERMEELQQKEQEAGSELQEKVQKFQAKVQSFQRRAQSGNMTPKQIENEQRVLAQQEQELALEQQSLAQEFQLEAATLQNRITDHLREEVSKLQGERNYDYIISYGSGSNVLAVNPAHDLTTIVVERMNAGQVPTVGTLDTLQLK